MRTKIIWSGIITLGLVAFLPVAHADYVNESEFANNGQAAQVLEAAIDQYLRPIEVQQIGNAVYNSAENYSFINMGTTNPSSSPQIDFVTQHTTVYCSPNVPNEKNAFNCTGQSQNTDSTTAQLLEMGDLRPSVLLEPTAYNNQALWWAAHNYIRNVTMPFPTPTFANFISKPETFANNASQRRAYANYMANQSLLSVARYALDEMFGMRIPGNSMGGNAGNAGTLSIMQVMENEASRRFMDPNYAGSANSFLNAASTTQVDILRDMAAMQAFDLWMKYQTYKQNERIAALLSAMLAKDIGTALSGSTAAISAGAPQ